VTSSSGTKHLTDKVFAGNFADLGPNQRLNAIANSVIHETAAHQFHATLEGMWDQVVYSRGAATSANPEVRRRRGTVADSYAYGDDRTRANVTGGPIPIDPEDRRALVKRVGPSLRVEPPSKEAVKISRVVARHAGLAFIAHSIVAVGVLSLDRTSGGANIYGWDAVRLLRLVEYPVLWAIDGILQHFVILPLKWFDPNFELAYYANIALTYVLVGGAFYAGLAAGMTLLLGGRRSRPTTSERAAQTPSQA
jgi:hypothetical protein